MGLYQKKGIKEKTSRVNINKFNNTQGKDSLLATGIKCMLKPDIQLEGLALSRDCKRAHRRAVVPRVQKLHRQVLASLASLDVKQQLIPCRCVGQCHSIRHQLRFFLSQQEKKSTTAAFLIVIKRDGFQAHCGYLLDLHLCMPRRGLECRCTQRSRAMLAVATLTLGNFRKQTESKQ